MAVAQGELALIGAAADMILAEVLTPEPDPGGRAEPERSQPEPETAPPSEGFVPDDADKIDWVLGKIADARQRAARIRENAERMAAAEETEAHRLEWKYGPAIQAWLRAELSGKRAKSVRLFHGVIGYRTKPQRFLIPPHLLEEAVTWARGNWPGLIQESVDYRSLQAACAFSEASGQAVYAETGEALPFVAVIPPEEVFYVKPA